MSAHETLILLNGMLVGAVLVLVFVALGHLNGDA